MNKQKFLDIKNRWETKEYMGSDEYNMVDDIAFLIAALEAAQAELAEARKDANHWKGLWGEIRPVLEIKDD